MTVSFCAGHIHTIRDKRVYMPCAEALFEKKWLVIKKITNLRVLKRIVAILLMGILFFNWYGYQLWSSYLEDQADRQLEASLDGNNYDESQLISIKIPSTHLSYYNSSQQFERVDGQIEIRGVEYKYVKRRLFNDSLELLCIPNHTVIQLQTAKNEFFKLVNDLQHNGQGKKGNSHPGASKNPASAEYTTINDLFSIGNLYFISLPKAFHDSTPISSSYFFTAEQPPDHLPGQC